MPDTNTKRFKYRFVLHKRYFDLGLALTSYVKYLIAFFGLATRDLKTTFMIAFIYAIACYFLGMIWIVFGFYEEEIEVNNQFNKFVKEFRKKRFI